MKKGFTLIELMVVVVIIAVIALFVGGTLWMIDTVTSDVSLEVERVIDRNIEACERLGGEWLTTFLFGECVFPPK